MPPISAGAELTDPGIVICASSVPLPASKARSAGGASAPTKTTPLATDVAPNAGGPFCSQGTVRAMGSKACMVGCWKGVSRGSFGSHGWPPKSPRAVPP